MNTFGTYEPGDYYDELIDEYGNPRTGAWLLVDKINSLPPGELALRQKAAEALLLKMGITFNVYGGDEGTEKIFPFDIIPRIVAGDDWQQIESGLKQRIFALNEFIQDIYNKRQILKDRVVPEDLILTSRTYRPECEGFTPPRRIWCHVTGTDLVRDRDGQFYVLEDNLRCPSGVSYVLENRQVLKRTFPQVFEASRVRPVDDYPTKLLEVLEHLAPDNVETPTIGVLTPGIYNSAYFEHSFLSQQMGVELVEGQDLVVSDGFVHMLTTKGLKRVDVLYRRIDDDFIDPDAFRPGSLLGVRGLIAAYKAGRIAMANAPGTGIADDKVIYAYVPEIVKYYTGEEAILPNVPTYICRNDEDRADILGVRRRYIRAGYEDLFYYLHQEQRLPVNVDPADPKLEDPEERARIVEMFQRGLGAVVGYVLPLQYGSWKSGPWPFRGGLMFLLPGDSPAGLRLPLASLPWVSEEDFPHDHPLDPMAARGPLPEQHPDQLALAGSRPAGAGDGVRTQPRPFADPAPVTGESAAWVVRTALCVQPRNGRLYVFMPPIESLEGYLELVAAVEAAARKTQMPVVIEGYTPPRDHRLKSLQITPDPGVIEVNIQPMHTWQELVDNTTALYETARQTRLGTEKFMLDGRHTGTGGGNHIVIGGATPADSPFLRRPDLLRSFVTYWNNHPSLSYLFSGLFIGPTSQQPRIDEARHDSLYELEIAFAELERQTSAEQPCPPWLVDRLFRHLLVDVSGNTHRAEFCIDKLFSPDSSAGRLGLLEFRGFEMPPHARMSLAQQLLMRIFVAWFWQKPYRQDLVRWGTRLHDRFMLPQPVQADFAEVLQELNRAGYPVTLDFFKPHFEFRFPIHGAIVCQGMEIELRQALEPWHVLGEEPGGGGTARYVDSSVERLQVKVSGMNGDRHLLSCNGRRVPLQPTRVEGVFVAGVRYRAWQPPSCLHPTIGVHTPLVIDLYDTWSGRAVGGCTYHVGHPGGRHYEVLPVNAYEAEGRCHSRFVPGGYSPGHLLAIPAVESNPHFPYTLDLRRRKG